MKGGGAIKPTGVEINNKNTVRSFVRKLLQKERKERMTLMPDENFEGDFPEVQENNHGITNAASAVLY
jgi:hypothetical protein